DAADELNREMSPGRLLDRYYLGQTNGGVTDYMKKLREDPVPAMLVGAAVLWAHKGDDITATAKDTAERARVQWQGAKASLVEKGHEMQGQVEDRMSEARGSAHGQIGR